MSTFEQAVCRSAAWRALTKRVALPWALQGVNLYGTVLEIGGGSGAMAQGALESFPIKNLVVTDIDIAMTGAAKKRLEQFNDRIAVVAADATALPFADESFDVALSFIMLHHVVGWERALEEAFRVLRPGGQLVGYDLLSTAPLRALHRVEGAAFRFMELDELRSEISRFAIDKARVRRSLGGSAVRFVVPKASKPVSAPK